MMFPSSLIESSDILIVDDNPTNLNVLSSMLTQHGHKVRPAINGDVALRVAQSIQPDLILLDIRMPGLSGYEICEQLKADDRTHEIPVIFISALDDIEDKLKGFEVGGVDYITKPFYMEEVLTRVNLHLRLQQLAGQLRQAKDVAEKASQSKTIFLANMNHELRSPLNAILGHCQLLARDPNLTAPQAESLRIINRSGEHLLSLINAVLDLSKIEAGQMVFQCAPFELSLFFQTVEALLISQVKAKQLQLVLDLDPSLPEYVAGDEPKLRQILINLLDNALKFTQVGEIRLRVRVQDAETLQDPKALQDASAHQIQFEVEDTGEGIAPEDQAILFQPFQQTQSGLRSKMGTGLGLSISYELVRLLGGELTLSSQVGQGSCFRFTIPFQPADAAHVSSSDSIFPIGLAPDQPSFRILVVDDQEDERIFLINLLQNVGFEVRSAQGGQEAVDLAASWAPNLIWMDMNMPEMDGYAATQQIKAQSQANLPVIIALTTSTFDHERDPILAAGCDDLVAKPVREGVLFDKIAQHLGVQYLYQACFNSDQSNALEASMGAEDQGVGASLLTEWTVDSIVAGLKQMSEEWLTQLYQAASQADTEWTIQLFQQLPTTDPRLTQSLQELADGFRFDTIVDLAQKAQEDRG